MQYLCERNNICYHSRMILPTHEDPKYVIVLRRDDEQGNPRYSPIAYAPDEAAGRKIISLISRRGKVGNEYHEDIAGYLEFLDILILVRYEDMLDISERMHYCWIVNKSNKPIYVECDRSPGWLGYWEGYGSEADDMVSEICSHKNEQYVLSMLFRIAYESKCISGISEKTVQDLRTLENYTRGKRKWSESKIEKIMEDVDLEYGNIRDGRSHFEERVILKFFDFVLINKFYKSAAIEIIRSISNAKARINNNRFGDNLKAMSGIVREIMPLKDILYLVATRRDV